MVFDILVAYGRSNTAIVNRFIQTILKIEPKYEQDLVESLNFLKTAFKTVQQKTEANETGTSFDDLALYALDCAYTIHTLIEIFPASHEYCRSVNMEQTVTNFYDSTIPMLYKNINIVNTNAIGVKYLNHCRIELLAFFRSIGQKYLDRIMANP